MSRARAHVIVRWRSFLSSPRARALSVASVALLAIIAGTVWVGLAGGSRPAHRVPSAASSIEPTLPISVAPSAAVPPPKGSAPAAPSAPATGTPTTGRATAPTGHTGAYTWTTAPAMHVDTTWVSQTSARTGIPARALTAYADAQVIADVVEPSCHLPWTMLAGIGLVESNHGRHGGATLLPDGATSVRILGPALDGTHGNVAIHATPDGVRMDGDPVWDHAVGPMQFIPSTWVHWGVSDDQTAPNPNDIDDAALTAARYLCSAGGDLSTAQGWHNAIGAYNAPASYEEQVVKAATTYAQQTLS